MTLTAMSPVIEEIVGCRTFVDILQTRARLQGDQVGYVFLRRGEAEDTRLTYGELDARARAIAVRLYADKGIAVGSRALLTFPPGLEFVVTFFGCLYAGIIPVPAYPPRRNQSLSRLNSIIADAHISIILGTKGVTESIAERLKFSEMGLEELPILATDQIDFDSLSRQSGSFGVSIQRTENALAFLQYTSGSTGSPKGVMVSHANLMNNSATIYRAFNHSADSCGVIWLPPYHDMGLIGGVLQPLYGGFPVYLMSPVDFLQKPFRWLDAITRYGGTTSGGPNFGFELCLQRVSSQQRQQLDLRTWSVAFNGAEPIRWKTFERFEATFGDCGFRQTAFYPCYGMAETTLFVTGGLANQPPTVLPLDRYDLENNQVTVLATVEKNVTTLEDHRVRYLVSSGLINVHSNQSIMIVNVETLKPLPEGHVGEILVQSDSVALGYWKKIQATEATFCCAIEGLEGTFLRTGDLGFIFAGELYVTGRIKDVMIFRGRNYYPQDIEHTVEHSHPALKSAGGAAVGVEIEGEERLVIIHEVDRQALKTLDSADVIGSIRQAINMEYSLAVYAVVLVKPGILPKTSSGKIQHYACRQQYLSGSFENIEAWCLAA